MENENALENLKRMVSIVHSEIPYHLWKDKEFIMKAIKINPETLRYALTLKNNKKFVLYAIQKHKDAFIWAPNEVRNHLKIFLKVIKNPRYIFYATYRLKSPFSFNRSITLNVKQKVKQIGIESEFSLENIIINSTNSNYVYSSIV